MAQPLSYAVVRRLGRGGMGVVDLAERADGVQVALKRLPLHGTPEELARARQRVKREATVLAALDHPGIVKLLDVHDADDEGHRCVANRADYDGNARNGCEAAPDRLDGSTVHSALRANLVPAADTDTYKIHVTDHFQFTCDGRVHVTLIAPSQVTERLVVRRGRTVVATATSADREPGTATVKDPNCGADDTETLTARVSSVGTDRTDHLYTLKVSGSY